MEDGFYEIIDVGGLLTMLLGLGKYLLIGIVGQRLPVSGFSHRRGIYIPSQLGT